LAAQDFFGQSFKMMYYNIDLGNFRLNLTLTQFLIFQKHILEEEKKSHEELRVKLMD